MRRFAAILGVIALSTVALSVAPTHATVPGKNGRIAFRRYLNPRQTQGAIFTINRTGLFQVTHPPRLVVTANPQWSPDWHWIVYGQGKGRDPFDNGTARIYKIRANGTHRIYLSASCTGSCMSDTGPAFSPGGKHIVFTRKSGDHPVGTGVIALYLMRADGTHVHRVTQRHVQPGPRPHKVVDEWGGVLPVRHPPGVPARR
jgi:TolB protein